MLVFHFSTETRTTAVPIPARRNPPPRHKHFPAGNSWSTKSPHRPVGIQQIHARQENQYATTDLRNPDLVSKRKNECLIWIWVWFQFPDLRVQRKEV